MATRNPAIKQPPGMVFFVLFSRRKNHGRCSLPINSTGEFTGFLVAINSAMKVWGLVIHEISCSEIHQLSNEKRGYPLVCLGFIRNEISYPSSVGIIS